MTQVAVPGLPLSMDFETITLDGWDEARAKFHESDAATKEYKSVIIAFDFQNDPYIKSLREQFGEDAVKDSHITVMFLGDMNDHGEKTKQEVMTALYSISIEQAPIQGNLTGAATFLQTESSDGKYPVVVLYDSPRLPFFRVDLQRYLRGIVGHAVQDHGFIPHITLAYLDHPVQVEVEPKEIIIDKICLWWGDEKYNFPLTGNVVEKGGAGSGFHGHQGRPGEVGGSRSASYVYPAEVPRDAEIVEKQFPISDESKANLIEIRRNLFYDEIDALSERMYLGEISLNQYEETGRRLIRELHSSVAAIGKGGWGEMTWADWGRLGPQMKEQYRYWHGFVEKIAENRDTISLQAIKARSHLYGEAATNSAYLMEAGEVIAKRLPWLPRDGSTQCLVRCKCQWDLEIVGKEKDFNVIKCVWKLNPAEHCEDCLERNGYTVTIRVYKDIPIPGKIGGY